MIFQESQNQISQLPLPVGISNPSPGTSDKSSKEDHQHQIGPTSFGFRVTRSTNEAVLATGTNRNITFDTVQKQIGDWIANTGLSTNSFTVPVDEDGLYDLSAGVYWAAGVINVFVGIQVNGIAVAHGSGTPLAVDRTSMATAHYLNAGDVIKLSVSNISGGNITITAFAGDAVTPIFPFLSVWRISK